MEAVAVPVEEGEPRVSAMPPAVGDPIDLAPEGDVIVTAVTGSSGVTDAVETAPDGYIAAPDADEYAYAAGLTEPVTIPGAQEPEPPLEDEYALFESAEDTFGGAGADAANAGVQSFRAFLVIWLHTSAELDVEFDASETQVR
jgi:hypothetical protein